MRQIIVRQATLLLLLALPAGAEMGFYGWGPRLGLGDDSARRDYTKQLLRDFPDSPEAQRIRQSG